MKRVEAHRAYLTSMLLLSVLVILPGCGGEFGGGNWNTPIVPTVSSTVPANAATSVAISNNLAVTFSAAMDPATITATTFTVKQGATTVLGTVTYSGLTALFTPTVALASNTVYTARITTGAWNLAGTALASDYVWSFTTAPATVTLTVPANAATGVPTGNKLTAAFSEAMAPATINATTFSLNKGTTAIAGTVAYFGVTAVFTPTIALDAGAEYTATITTGAKDLAGNALASNYVWSFTTGAAPDTTTPTMIHNVPATAATGVSTNTKLTAAFSETMDPATLDAITFTLKQGATAVPGTVSCSGATAVFTPASFFASSATYTATISTGAKDLAGNATASHYVWSFTTGATQDSVKPSVTLEYPANLAANAPINKMITATFSEAMDPLTITTASFTVAGVTGTVIYDATSRIATFTPAGNLAAGATYTATITTGARDLAGNPLANAHTWTFTTATPP